MLNILKFLCWSRKEIDIMVMNRQCADKSLVDSSVRKPLNKELPWALCFYNSLELFGGSLHTMTMSDPHAQCGINLYKYVLQLLYEITRLWISTIRTVWQINPDWVIMPLDQVFNEPLENAVNFFSTMELKKVSFRLLTKSVWIDHISQPFRKCILWNKSS